MEFSWNRKLFLQNEDVPVSMPPLPDTHSKHATNASSTWPPESSALELEKPTQVSIRPVFSSSAAYIFLILFTTFFFIGFVILYFQQFASSDTVRFRRRGEEEEEEEASSAEKKKKSLAVVVHRGEWKQVECTICLEEFGDGEAVKMIRQCKHVFHPQCIDTWLDKHVTCPVCRCSELCCAEGEQNEEVRSVSEGEEEVVPIPNLD